MSEIKNGGLDQYGAEPFEQQQFGTAGVERVKVPGLLLNCVCYLFTGLSCNIMAEFIFTNFNALSKILVITFACI